MIELVKRAYVVTLEPSDASGGRVSVAAQRAVLVRLAEYANGASGEAWPSLTTLARETGFSKRTVQRALDALVSRSCITRKSGGGRTPGGRGIPSVYRVTLPPVRERGHGDHVPVDQRGHDDAMRGHGDANTWPLRPTSRKEPEGTSRAPAPARAREEEWLMRQGVGYCDDPRTFCEEAEEQLGAIGAEAERLLERARELSAAMGEGAA